MFIVKTTFIAYCGCVLITGGARLATDLKQQAKLIAILKNAIIDVLDMICTRSRIIIMSNKAHYLF